MVVPEYNPVVAVEGAVTSPSTVLYRQGAGLDYYIANAGGYARNADEGRVSVRYANGSAWVKRKFLFFGSTPGPGSLVTVPLIISLFFREDSQLWQPIFLAVVSVLIGGLDNIIRPLFVGEGLRMHPIWLLLSILGAMRAFGPIGLIYGPMVLVLLGTFVRLLVQEEGGQLARTAQPGKT